MSNCPVECPNGKKYFDIKRREKCESCPHRENDKKFKDAAEILIFTNFGYEEKFNFTEYRNALFTVLSLEDLPEKEVSFKTEEMLSVYYREKSRADKILEIERERERQRK